MNDALRGREAVMGWLELTKEGMGRRRCRWVITVVMIQCESRVTGRGKVVLGSVTGTLWISTPPHRGTRKLQQ